MTEPNHAEIMKKIHENLFICFDVQAAWATNAYYIVHGCARNVCNLCECACVCIG